MNQRPANYERPDIDLNTAGEKELAELPMVGSARARALIEHRPFRDWDEVRRVPGFDQRLVEDLKRLGLYLGTPGDT
jgi:DNA uptake protein ComE-like DNA-binding protein